MIKIISNRLRSFEITLIAGNVDELHSGKCLADLVYSQQALGFGVQQLVDPKGPLDVPEAEIVSGIQKMIDCTSEDNLGLRYVKGKGPVEFVSVGIHPGWNNEQVLICREQEGLVLPLCS